MAEQPEPKKWRPPLCWGANDKRAELRSVIIALNWRISADACSFAKACLWVL